MNRIEPDQCLPCTWYSGNKTDQFGAIRASICHRLNQSIRCSVKILLRSTRVPDLEHLHV